MDRAVFLYGSFLRNLPLEPTSCQDRMFRQTAEFLTEDDADILVVNGYAGTGKTTAVSAIIRTMRSLETPCVLLAPTGRSAKVLSSYTGMPASTVHKHIYRQKSHGEDGFGRFELGFNKAKNTLFIVDEVSLLTNEDKSSLFAEGNVLNDLVSFVRSGAECRLIFIGDSAQLPPIGLEESPALSPAYMDGFGGVRYTGLTTVVRQQKESGILYNATRIRTILEDPLFEDMPLDELGLRTDGFDDICRIGGGDLLETLSDAYSRFGEDETIVLCRSNKRAIRYNAGIRAQVQYKEDRLVRGDRLMIVKNCYHFVDEVEGMDYIANGDIAKLIRISHFEERYGLNFAEARLSLPDYRDQELTAKVLLDTLESESPSLSYELSNRLYQGVDADYSHIASKQKRYKEVREDPYFNALQLKYANAITCHKSQGGQWKCVFIDNAFWQDFLVADDLKWLYTALTRAVEKVYLVNFKDSLFKTDA
ncbi:MAG: AAA family ATPase [Bacteroidales bacterium]|nr:AAA family ATPase [Bacteroidales bacterium]